jgi:hypothetical protein
MNAETEYLRSEAKNILATTGLVEELLGKKKLNRFEVMLDEKQLRDLAGPAVPFCREFLKKIC